VRKAKIVVTLGPASNTHERIAQLVAAGMDVARLNFSHGSHQSHAELFKIVRACAAEARRPVAVLADLCGPKLRLGRVRDGAVSLERGQTIDIVTGEDELVGDAARVATSYQRLPQDVKPGDRLLVDDGRLELRVVECDTRRVRCEVVVGGTLRDRKGLNLPGVALSVPALTDKDRDDLRFARELGADYFALSFVRSAADVLEAKALAGEIPVIAKIEKPEAVENFGPILDAADGVMVARGDLGVEAGAEKVPLIQKWLIRETNRRGKLVITATQMLESMVTSASPTRAEVSDVANAVLDGTDAVMLSGETAAGAYPVEALAKMDSIICEIESSELFASLSGPEKLTQTDFSTAIASAAVRAECSVDLRAIAVFTETGHSAAIISEFRPRAAIVALSRHAHVLNRLALHWGVQPVHSDWVEEIDVAAHAEAVLLEHALVAPGDRIAITYGLSDGALSRTDNLRLLTVRG